MTFHDLQDQLRNHILARIRRRELTGSGLARQAGFPQGHLSNFLNSRRGLSLESMDRLLEKLEISAVDLLKAEDIQRRALRSAGAEHLERVAIVSRDHAALPRFEPDQILGTRPFDRSFLHRLKASSHHDRADWLRFVLIVLDVHTTRSIFPLAIAPATLLIDRHYSSLDPYRRMQPNLYLVSFGGRCLAGYLSYLDRRLILRTRDPEEELPSVPVPSGRDCSQFIIGRVCNVGLEV
jgi:hypothetical protein